MMAATVAFNMGPNVGGILQMFLGCEPAVDIDQISEEKKGVKIHFIVAQNDSLVPYAWMLEQHQKLKA